MAKISRAPKPTLAIVENPLAAFLTKRRIGKDDVAALRRSDLAMGLRSKAEAEMMFAIERGRSEKCRDWGEFLVQTLTDFVVWDQRPAGVLDEDAALWLSEQVGEKPTPACLALLVSVMDEAEVVPTWFVPAVRLRASRVFGRKEGSVVHHPA